MTLRCPLDVLDGSIKNSGGAALRNVHYYLTLHGKVRALIRENLCNSWLKICLAHRRRRGAKYLQFYY